jgi:GNAT superfamily N-acetyltransferase
MGMVNYRAAVEADVGGMARIRAAYWETEEFWRVRIANYLADEAFPQQALRERVVYVAVDGETVVGFIAGHRTRRYGCDGELEWIDVIAERRGSGVAGELLRRLAEWFVERKALRVCVDVDPANVVARRFYTRHGAETLNPHWLVWKDIRVVAEKEQRASN